MIFCVKLLAACGVFRVLFPLAAFTAELTRAMFSKKTVVVFSTKQKTGILLF